jgi:hypothetical protein
MREKYQYVHQRIAIRTYQTGYDNMSERNPLIGSSTIETVQNVSEALESLIILMSPGHSGLCRLLAPLAHALEHAGNEED